MCDQTMAIGRVMRQASTFQNRGGGQRAYNSESYSLRSPAHRAKNEIIIGAKWNAALPRIHPGSTTSPHPQRKEMPQRKAMLRPMGLVNAFLDTK